MANPNEEQQQPVNNSLHDSLMADLYFGTPMGLDNNSGEFNVPQNAQDTEENQIQ